MTLPNKLLDHSHCWGPGCWFCSESTEVFFCIPWDLAELKSHFKECHPSNICWATLMCPDHPPCQDRVINETISQEAWPLCLALQPWCWWHLGLENAAVLCFLKCSAAAEPSQQKLCPKVMINTLCRYCEKSGAPPPTHPPPIKVLMFESHCSM